MWIDSRDHPNNKGLLLMAHTPNSTFGERAFSPLLLQNYGTN